MRNGADVQAPSVKHAHKEMLLQCARDYAGLPDPRSLTLAEVAFFYEGLRPELRKHTRFMADPTPSKPKRKHGK